MREIAEEIRKQTLEQLDLSEDLTDEQVRFAIEQTLTRYGREHYLPLETRRNLTEEIFHGIRGLDILEELLAEAKSLGITRQELIEKIEGLSNRYFRSKVKHICNQPIDMPENKELFYTIETLEIKERYKEK